MRLKLQKFTVSEATLKEAKRRFDNFPLIKNSIRSREGGLVGYIGEALVLHLEGGEIKDTYDYDLISSEGVKIDVKTKERKVAPRGNYNCTVADFNTKQKCDRYVFVRIEWIKGKWGRAWVLGWLEHQEYFTKANKLNRGEIDVSNGFLVKADCYNVPINALRPFRRRK